jgi:exonuclease SbcD
MRILHTADWHLGKILHGASLLDDQAHILAQFVDIARREKPDVIIIAGDLYDRAVPPAEAVALLSKTLAELAADPGVPILAIAGNHDSADRVAFGSELFAKANVHLAGRFDPANTEPITIDSKHGRAQFFLLPFLYPAEVREALHNEEITSHEQATRATIDTLRPHFDKDARQVLIAHAFVAGGIESESERPLSVGGSGTVPAAIFEDFDYVALGHLHASQEIDFHKVRYSGSPLKYSFSEIAHDKSTTLVDLHVDGDIHHLEEIPLTPRRDLRKLEGDLESLLTHKPDPRHRDDYLLVELTDTGALLDPMGRLREIYPNILLIERPALEHHGDGEGRTLTREDLKQDEVTLFKNFYQQVTGNDLEEDQQKAITSTVEGLNK